MTQVGFLLFPLRSFSLESEQEFGLLYTAHATFSLSIFDLLLEIIPFFVHRALHFDYLYVSFLFDLVQFVLKTLFIIMGLYQSLLNGLVISSRGLLQDLQLLIESFVISLEHLGPVL